MSVTLLLFVTVVLILTTAGTVLELATPRRREKLQLPVAMAALLPISFLIRSYVEWAVTP